MVVLPGQVENVVFALDDLLDRQLVPDVAVVDGNAMSDGRNVKQITSLPGCQVIKDGDVCAELNECNRQIAPDKYQASGDEDFFF